MAPLNPYLQQVLKETKEPPTPAPPLALIHASEHCKKEDLIAADNRRRSLVLSTCYSYRQARKDFYSLRKGRYNRLCYLKNSRARSERFKESNWIMFNNDVLGHRKNQAYNWCADLQDAEYVISQIKDPLDPWKGVRWPWYSSCRINPIPTDPELTLRYRPEVFSTQSALISQLKYHKQMVKKLTLELNN